MLIDRQMLRVLIEADSDRLRKLQLTGKDHGPGFPAATEADLRRDLKQAIEARDKANDCVRIASQTLTKAQHLACEAGERAAGLKSALEADNTARVNARAAAVLAALRAGSAAPNAAAPWPALTHDSVELTAALAEHAALKFRSRTPGNTLSLAV
jgi:hypothetical protein